MPMMIEHIDAIARRKQRDVLYLTFREVEFWLLPLNIAMKNAEHDERGFWERWAEKF